MFYKKKIIICIFLLFSIKLFSIEFSADQILQDKYGKISKGKLFVSENKVRFDFVDDRTYNNITMIIRQDKNLLLIIFHKERIYIETDLSKENQLSQKWLELFTLKREYKEKTFLTKEKIDKYQTNKYKFLLDLEFPEFNPLIMNTEKHIKKVSGYVWESITLNNFPIKIIQNDEHGKINNTIELKNIKISKQLEGIFNVGTGYKKTDWLEMLKDFLSSKTSSEESNSSVSSSTFEGYEFNFNLEELNEQLKKIIKQQKLEK